MRPSQKRARETQLRSTNFFPKSRGRSIFVPTAVPEETAEPIVDLLIRGVSVVGIAARENLTANGVARKWRRKGLKRLNPRPEMVWSRKTRTHKMWYPGPRLPCATSRPPFCEVNLDWTPLMREQR